MLTTIKYTAYMKKSDSKKSYDWLVWPQAYFDLAIIGCLWLEKATMNEIYLSNETEHESIQPPQYCIFPIVYDFKHGVEIYLKGLLAVYKGEYDANSHDLISLLNLLISKISESKTIKEKQELLEILDRDIRNLIEKYYFGFYFGKNKYKNLPDTKNQAERYPEQKSYKIPEFFSCWMQQGLEDKCPENEIDVQAIKNDITKTYKIFRDVVGKKLIKNK